MPLCWVPHPTIGDAACVRARTRIIPFFLSPGFVRTHTENIDYYYCCCVFYSSFELIGNRYFSTFIGIISGNACMRISLGAAGTSKLFVHTAIQYIHTTHSTYKDECFAISFVTTTQSYTYNRPITKPLKIVSIKSAAPSGLWNNSHAVQAALTLALAINFTCLIRIVHFSLVNRMVAVAIEPWLFLSRCSFSFFLPNAESVPCELIWRSRWQQR